MSGFDFFGMGEKEREELGLRKLSRNVRIEEKDTCVEDLSRENVVLEISNLALAYKKVKDLSINEKTGAQSH